MASPQGYLDDNRSYKSHTRSFSMAEESSNVKNLLHQDAEVSTKNIKTVINYEKKIQNRVRYLAQEEKRMQAKMNVMQAKIEQRNKALQKKEMDNLRLVLLKKKDEALAIKRREDVQDRMVERLITKQEKEIEAAKVREKLIAKNRLEKAINQLETDIVKENSSISLYDRAD